MQLSTIHRLLQTRCLDLAFILAEWFKAKTLFVFQAARLAIVALVSVRATGVWRTNVGGGVHSPVNTRPKTANPSDLTRPPAAPVFSSPSAAASRFRPKQPHANVFPPMALFLDHELSALHSSVPLSSLAVLSVC
ncbi:hypothetical protein PMIN01_07314 [Paraphaeosphaeria minitans]|uniref:Uncharacterized protein n=1 Tax=Paraphaeosphaeria minitans TaxID=565426 RepID=A0A9P6KQ49_9PLEO|nr:hypothetical protein PMIN01_07314 [Paraphaeosphaeria minitans]